MVATLVVRLESEMGDGTEGWWGRIHVELEWGQGKWNGVVAWAQGRAMVLQAVHIPQSSGAHYRASWQAGTSGWWTSSPPKVVKVTRSGRSPDRRATC